MLKKLTFENFRNYKKAEVEINSNLVLILGNNAAGKTNIVEGIYYLSHLNSFRVRDNFLAKIGETFFNIKAEYDENKFEIIVQVDPTVKRVFKINEQKTSRMSWQSFRTVLFEPSDLELFSQGPSLRRKYLNQTISQVSKLYAADISSLDHILKQKAVLLSDIAKGRAEVKELGFWNEQLSEAGVRITEDRKKFLEFLNQKINNLYHNLTSFTDILTIDYKSNAPKTHEDYLRFINSHQEAEIKSGQVLIGPHRDDFTVNKNNLINLANSSRGELRSQVLAIKLLQAEYLTDADHSPIIILDDVFSELDETRRSFLLKNLKTNQIFITSTEEHHLPELSLEAQILRVSDGVISS